MCVCGGGGGGVERELQACLSSLFFLLLGKKQHRNIFSNHTGRLAKFGWILTYLKISVEMAVTWFLPGAIQLFIHIFFIHSVDLLGLCKELCVIFSIFQS